MGQVFPFGSSADQPQEREKLSKLVATDSNILISGSNRTRRQECARYIHQQSPRSKAAFVSITCSEFPAEVFENKLFGPVDGRKPLSDGLAAAADGGTLFLDDVDSLAVVCQIQLLRFLQEKEYRQLGETRIKQLNVRVIAATNADLLATVGNGQFREDLFNAFTCVRLDCLTSPYGLLGALPFVLAPWVLFAILVALTTRVLAGPMQSPTNSCSGWWTFSA